LFVSANIFSAKPRVEQGEFAERDEVYVSQLTRHEGPHRRAGETHADYLNAHGGSLPLVAAHQTAEHKHLHKAVAGKQHAGKATRSQTRAERRAARRAERQARRAERQAVHATTLGN
jgi:hypothetical protein